MKIEIGIHVDTLEEVNLKLFILLYRWEEIEEESLPIEYSTSESHFSFSYKRCNLRIP